jgi:hypothetical protein
MNDPKSETVNQDTSLSGKEPAVQHLENAIKNGRNWFIALLEAIGLWSKAEETYNGRIYHYLIAGEAFDWILLAERLCDTVAVMIPEDEKDAFVFHGQLPINLSAEKFKELIGLPKYHHYLNYFYGVTAEEALVLAVEEEVRKEKQSWGYSRDIEATNEAYRRVYGATFTIMLRHFRKEKNIGNTRSIDLTELKEFAYWRFKYRLKMCEKAKVASDSRKAINWLREHGVTSYIQRRDIPEFFEESPDEATQV